MCPRPPIPITPTRDEGRTPVIPQWTVDRDAHHTATELHSRSPAPPALGSQTGCSRRTLSAYPPCRPTHVGLTLRAKVLVPLPAPLANATTIRLPADAHPLPGLQVAHLRAYRRYLAPQSRVPE